MSGQLFTCGREKSCARYEKAECSGRLHILESRDYVAFENRENAIVEGIYVGLSNKDGQISCAVTESLTLQRKQTALLEKLAGETQ